LREGGPGSITVGFLDPVIMVSVTGRDDLKTFADDVRERLVRVRDSL
jgi:hypothetical protein